MENLKRVKFHRSVQVRKGETYYYNSKAIFVLKTSTLILSLLLKYSTVVLFLNTDP